MVLDWHVRKEKALGHLDDLFSLNLVWSLYHVAQLPK